MSAFSFIKCSFFFCIHINISFIFVFLQSDRLSRYGFPSLYYYSILYYCLLYAVRVITILIELHFCRRNESSTSTLDRNDTLYSRGYGESRRTYSSRLDRDDTTDYKKVCSVFKTLYKLLLEISWVPGLILKTGKWCCSTQTQDTDSFKIKVTGCYKMCFFSCNWLSLLTIRSSRPD